MKDATRSSVPKLHPNRNKIQKRQDTIHVDVGRSPSHSSREKGRRSIDELLRAATPEVLQAEDPLIRFDERPSREEDGPVHVRTRSASGGTNRAPEALMFLQPTHTRAQTSEVPEAEVVGVRPMEPIPQTVDSRHQEISVPASVPPLEQSSNPLELEMTGDPNEQPIQEQIVEPQVVKEEHMPHAAQGRSLHRRTSPDEHEVQQMDHAHDLEEPAAHEETHAQQLHDNFERGPSELRNGVVEAEGPDERNPVHEATVNQDDELQPNRGDRRSVETGLRDRVPIPTPSLSPIHENHLLDEQETIDLFPELKEDAEEWMRLELELESMTRQAEELEEVSVMGQQVSCSVAD